MERKRFEELRHNFGIATGLEFDKNIKTNSELTKYSLIKQTTESYFIYEIIHIFLTDTELISFLFPGENRIDIEKKIENLFSDVRSVQNLRFESNFYIGKGHQLNQQLETLILQENKEQNITDINIIKDKFINVCRCIQQNENLKKVKYNDIEANFKNLMKEVLNSKSTKKHSNNPRMEEKINNFLFIVSNLNNFIQFNEELFDFIFVRDAIKNDPDFELKVTTAIYKVLYDSVSCYDLFLSMGLVGKTFIACLSSRSYHPFKIFTNHSRDILPKSAFVIFKLLGLSKNSFRLLENKLHHSLLLQKNSCPVR